MSLVPNPSLTWLRIPMIISPICMYVKFYFLRQSLPIRLINVNSSLLFATANIVSFVYYINKY